MASASASPQPPSNRSDAAARGGQGPETGKCAEGGKRGESARHERADEQLELYGPLRVERLVKQDGRALIVYARRERQGE